MRRHLDAYYTPASAVDTLLKYINVDGFRVMEPMSGDGAIARQLVAAGAEVITNDINPDVAALMHHDATDAAFWAKGGGVDWVITNPAFNVAPAVVPLAVKYADCVAMLLRLSFLEPCGNRAAFLVGCPPDALIVLPRISFTGDGKTDSVTCAWMVWSDLIQPGIYIESRPA